MPSDSPSETDNWRMPCWTLSTAGAILELAPIKKEMVAKAVPGVEKTNWVTISSKMPMTIDDSIAYFPTYGRKASSDAKLLAFLLLMTTLLMTASRRPLMIKSRILTLLSIIIRESRLFALIKELDISLVLLLVILCVINPTTTKKISAKSAREVLIDTKPRKRMKHKERSEITDNPEPIIPSTALSAPVVREYAMS